MRVSPEQLQHDHYTATAADYHARFVLSGDEHDQALQFMSALVEGFCYRSVVDVGCGTGRGVKHFLDHHPGVVVHGVEPVRAMIDQAQSAVGVPAGVIIQGRGQSLPFAESSVDAVFEIGVLHHVSDPDAIVREMTRVARRAVFLSDENRFARGGRLSQAVKYAIYRLGLWPALCRLRTGGRGYILSEGDGGVAYSYSVYDSLPTLGEWADRVFLVPTVPARTGWFHPLFGATHVLVCALRET